MAPNDPPRHRRPSLDSELIRVVKENEGKSKKTSFCVKLRRLPKIIHRQLRNEHICRYTGLSEKEKIVIQDVWRVVHRDLKGYGLEILVRYFAKHRRDMHLFPGLRLSNDITSNLPVRKHSYAMMEGLTKIIDHIWVPQQLERILLKIGRNHYHYKCNPEHFTKLGQIIVDFLAFKLGHLMTSQMMLTWRKFFLVLMAMIKRGMIEEKFSTNPIDSRTGLPVIKIQHSHLHHRTAHRRKDSYNKKMLQFFRSKRVDDKFQAEVPEIPSDHLAMPVLGQQHSSSVFTKSTPALMSLSRLKVRSSRKVFGGTLEVKRSERNEVGK